MKINRILKCCVESVLRRLDGFKLAKLGQVVNDISIEKTMQVKNLGNDLIDYLHGEPLVALDVGARLTRGDGIIVSDFIDPLIRNNHRYFSIIYCEADLDEARLLESHGFDVLRVALGKNKSVGNLFVTSDPGCSSIYPPNLPIVSFYDGSEGLARFRVVDEVEITIDTLDNQLRGLDVHCLDYLKIDTQGSELDILEGLGDYRPFLINTEVSIVPLYERQPLAYEIDAFLGSLGYLRCFDQCRSFNAFGDVKAPSGAKKNSETGLQLHGNAWFCPNLATGKGMAIAERDVRKFRALMKMIGLEGYVQSLMG